MPSWGNTDAANSLPLFPSLRDVRPVTNLVTANATITGNTTVVFTTAVPASVTAGLYVYAAKDANNALSVLAKDGSIIDQDDIDFYRSNNTVAAVTDAANGVVRFTNGVTGTLSAGLTVYFGTGIPSANVQYPPRSNDVILITATRIANTEGTTYGAGSTVANTLIGSVNAGWNRITRKINNDGTIRFLKETLVALANPVASNTSSANTSANAIFGGL